jgi:N utilization substance protein B
MSASASGTSSASAPSLGSRSVARTCALLVLFSVDATGQSAGSALAGFFRELIHDTGLLTDFEAREYAEQLVLGVTGSLEQIDETVRKASSNWRLERMTRVDRNVLRLGAWELMQGVPRAITIDEAVELGKRFGTEDSGKFVNGVLSRIADELRAS